MFRLHITANLGELMEYNHIGMLHMYEQYAMNIQRSIPSGTLLNHIHEWLQFLASYGSFMVV